jgi:hypothetical protein
MSEQNDKIRTQSRVKRGSTPFRYLVLIIVIGVVIAFYFYQKNNSSPTTGNDLEKTTAVGERQDSGQTASPSSASGPAMEQNGSGPGSLPSGRDTTVSAIDDLRQRPPFTSVDQEEPTGTTAPLVSQDISGRIQQRLSAGGRHQLLIDEINSFYLHLDQQPYMQDLGQNKPSKEYFSTLLQKLADNPPVVHRETDDLFTILQNTAHFFRILGKDNLLIIKEILDQERISFEQTLKSFYGLTYQPEYLEREYSLSLAPDVLTDYAAFFLNTIGGRLYLFRRDPGTRMLVSFYAVVTIDRANSRGDGGHGIDLRPAIRSLIEELDNGGRRLRWKDEYLDVLYDLQEKYNEPGP